MAVIEQRSAANPELEYTPDGSGVTALVRTFSARRVLLVGGQEILGLAAAEVRRVSPPGPIAANGAYIFRSNQGVDLLVCSGGSRPGAPMTGDEADLADDHPLLKARAWFAYLWEQGTEVGPRPRFAVGDYVKVAGSDQIGRIERRERVEGSNVYVVSINGQQRTVTEAGLVEHQVEANDPASWLRATPASARELSVSLTLTKLTNPLTDTIYSYLSSKTVIRP